LLKVIDKKQQIDYGNSIQLFILGGRSGGQGGGKEKGLVSKKTFLHTITLLPLFTKIILIKFSNQQQIN